MTQRLEIEVSAAEHRMRLEDFLCSRFTGLSKMYLRDVVKKEQCEVNGRFENRGFLVRTNDFIEIEVDLSRETAMRPENVSLDIIFEDGHLLIVNKPAGMLVHPTHRDKNGTLLNALSFYLNAGRGTGNSELFDNKSAFLTPNPTFARPGLIHRLDKQTSGLMVIAKTPRAHRILSEHFRKKLVDKRYLALADGIVKDDQGIICAPIGRFAEIKQWHVKPDGKPAETRFCVKERFDGKTLLDLEPVTGRTNQLRIHCAHIGHPIVGDTERGGRDFERLCLHAYKLDFWHPNGGAWMKFEIDAPAEMLQKS